MPIARSARVHPTAVISNEADVADGVEIGPYVTIDGPVQIGPNCRVRAHACLVGPLTLGRDNDVGIGVILGERPQHLLYRNEPTRTQIGDGNIFREHVTVHRGGPSGGVTVVGSHNFLMVNAHVGHDAVLGDHCILANGALVGGHCVLYDRAFVSGNAAIHQFVRIGRLALLSGATAATRDLPPFLLSVGRDTVNGVNVIGMRRAGMPAEEIAAVRRAFHILYRQNQMLSVAVQRLERELGHITSVREMVEFIRTTKRGVLGGHHRSRDGDAEAA
jgi:UDP-N-acetylglucosamine acyltransferase